MGGRLESPRAASSGRCLKTGTETLQALQLLASTPDGLHPDELALRLGKSKATARYLLNTLCQEGFAYRDGTSGGYRLAEAPPWGPSWGSPRDAADELPAGLSDALTELHARTRQRSYLARVEDDKVAVLDIRGRQGLPKIPGLTETVPVDQAHALAVTKALAAVSPSYLEVLRAEDEHDRFTHTTITDGEAFEDEMARVRWSGFALDREEFAEGFCCIAAPVFGPSGQVAASLALSVPTRRFQLDYLSLIADVVTIANSATQQWRESTTEFYRAGRGDVQFPPPREGVCLLEPAEFEPPESTDVHKSVDEARDIVENVGA